MSAHESCAIRFLLPRFSIQRHQTAVAASGGGKKKEKEKKGRKKKCKREVALRAPSSYMYPTLDRRALSSSVYLQLKLPVLYVEEKGEIWKRAIFATTGELWLSHGPGWAFLTSVPLYFVDSDNSASSAPHQDIRKPQQANPSSRSIEIASVDPKTIVYHHARYGFGDNLHGCRGTAIR